MARMYSGSSSKGATFGVMKLDPCKHGPRGASDVEATALQMNLSHVPCKASLCMDLVMEECSCK